MKWHLFNPFLSLSSSILISSDSWAGLTKLSSSGRTVSGIVACGLHCHSDRDCSAFAFVQDGKTCQMAKLVTHFIEYIRPTIERLLYIRMKAAFLRILSSQTQTTKQQKFMWQKGTLMLVP